MNHTSEEPCPCLEGRNLQITVKSGAAASYAGLSIHTDKTPISYRYQTLIESQEGKVVDVTHVFRGAGGLPTSYSVRGTVELHLRPILAVEGEPFARADAISAGA